MAHLSVTGPFQVNIDSYGNVRSRTKLVFSVPGEDKLHVDAAYSSVVLEASASPQVSHTGSATVFCGGSAQVFVGGTFCADVMNFSGDEIIGKNVIVHDEAAVQYVLPGKLKTLKATTGSTVRVSSVVFPTRGVVSLNAESASITVLGEAKNKLGHLYTTVYNNGSVIVECPMNQASVRAFNDGKVNLKGAVRGPVEVKASSHACVMLKTCRGGSLRAQSMASITVEQPPASKPTVLVLSGGSCLVAC